MFLFKFIDVKSASTVYGVSVPAKDFPVVPLKEAKMFVPLGFNVCILGYQYGLFELIH